MKFMIRGEKALKQNKLYENLNLISLNIGELTKKISVSSNTARTKTFLTTKSVFQSIAASIEQILRVPPKNKTFVSNSILSIYKYINALIYDYVKQIRKEKEDISIEVEKTCYPLNILVMERMTFKYGLKDISEKKIKDFIEKILTFSSVSEKVEIYSLLLGLTNENAGTDELLVYLKCMAYFETRKVLKETLERTFVEADVVR